MYGVRCWRKSTSSIFFQFEYISTTVVPLSIIESTNSSCTQSGAGDTHVSAFISVSTHRQGTHRRRKLPKSGPAKLIIH